jgi:Flp pilus assembly pilin Flp
MIDGPKAIVQTTPKLVREVIVSHQMGASHDSRDSGQGLVEYALILTLVVVVVIVVLISMGGQVKAMLSNVSTALGV